MTEMRCAWMGVLLAVAAVSHGDRVIYVPTATKILNRHFRVEHLWEPTKSNRFDTMLGVGVTRDIEVEFVLNRFDQTASLGTFNASFQFVPPLVDTAPGLSLGVQDALDRTPDGRGYYFAFTYRLGLDGEYNSRTPLEISMGGMFGRRNGLFVGVQLPFTWQFRGLVEHDTRRVTGGFEYRPLHGFAVRALWRQGQTLLGVRYTAKF